MRHLKKENKIMFPLVGIQQTPSFEIGINLIPKCGIFFHLGWHTVRFMWAPIMGALPEMASEYDNAGPPLTIEQTMQSLLVQVSEAVSIIEKTRGQWIHSVHAKECLDFLSKFQKV